MHIEIEAKMKIVDMASIRERLRALGARQTGEFEETNIYFDTEDHTLKAYDQGLRIRISRDCGSDVTTVYITHKGPRSHGGLKRRSETEVHVQSAENAAALLIELGYGPSLTFEKKREYWQLDQTHVMLDTLPLIGPWIEIEGKTEADVIAVREQLELDDAPLIKASYAGMLRTYAIENAMREDVFRFEEVAAG
ncbi:class IV adenylate cyclase [Mucisphaera calidilacus]|uniref:CYTH domain protein n=1 Tax=Mucisphaera calidilacus TaxID=2527982 RepID=A0A518BVZ1_9BACT|nr:class IV adenylate cyclase [Mucisphaera calidilacus]QDU71145.1 CYTH domain protein [Mucisphaera calidilacus]